ncbi:MFS transporter [Ferrimonas pelagia]|uniref:MFS transporter n=1 Tax=Ferrimonas pelagia TaxID=1177826 RepID=A0ABP9EH39_9GAMM
MTTSPLTGRQGKALAACYFCFFAILGLLVPYLGLYLDGLGFHSLEIGQLLAILFATRIIAPNLWAALADHLGKRVAIIRLGAALAALTFAGLSGSTAFVTLALVMALFTFFWNAILAQLEAVTLTSLGERSHQYGTLRSFGSVGYIVMVVGAGWWFERHGASALPHIGLLVFAALVLTSWFIREPAEAAPAQRHQASLGFVEALRQPKVILFLLTALLIQASHGPFYTFYVLYLIQLGFGEAWAGALVALGVIAEIGIFALAPRLLARWSLSSLMLVGCALAALRWLMTDWMGMSLSGQALAALLHAFSFGLTHACAIAFVHGAFASADQGKAQALYASLSFGVGGALGAYLSGILWQNGDGAHVTWWSAAMAALAAGLIMLLFKFFDAKRETDPTPV